MQELVDGGVCCFKLSTFGTDPGRFPRIPPQQMEAVMRAVAPHGLAVGVHNENHEYVMAATEAVHAQGLTGPEAHALARPALAEALAIGEIYEIGATTGLSSPMWFIARSGAVMNWPKPTSAWAIGRPSNAAFTIWCSARKRT